MIFVVLVPIVSFAETPYHSVDVNRYEDIIWALRRPEWLAKYIGLEFSYAYDEDQFGITDHHQLAREMFYRKKGDCEDYAAFNYEILKAHGYDPEAYVVWVPLMTLAHALVVFPYKGEWAMIDNIFYLQTGFERKIDALNGSVFSSPQLMYRVLSVPQNNYSEPRPEKYLGRDRIALDAHLTECNPGFYFYTPTFGYTQALHKEAIGYLWDFRKGNLWNLKAAGLGVSDHGFYSSSVATNDRVSSLYLLWPRVGVSLYGGDYSGIDVDWNPISGSLLKFYVCVRNFGEVVDYKLKLSPLKWLELDFEQNDEEFRWISWLRGSVWNQEIKIGLEENGIQLGIGPLVLGGRKENKEIKVFMTVKGAA